MPTSGTGSVTVDEPGTVSVSPTGDASRDATGRTPSDGSNIDPPPEADVRRALRSLIDGPALDDTAGSVDLAQASEIVAAAHEALADLDSAAAFVADGGIERLRDAIAAADRAGNRETARAGQRARATLQRYRRAASGDHFHPGRGTVFRPDGEVTVE